MSEPGFRGKYSKIKHTTCIFLNIFVQDCGSSHLNAPFLTSLFFILKGPEDWHELNLTDPNQPNHFGKNKQSPIDIKTSEVEEAIVPTVL